MYKHTGHTIGLVWGDMPASAFIQNSYLFRSLDEAGRRMLMMFGRIYSFEAGELLISEGDAGDIFYIIKQGKVEIFTIRINAVVPLNTLGKGGCIGEVAVLTNSKRTASVRAVEPVTAVGITREDINDLLKSYPKVREILNGLIKSRAKDTIDKLTQ
jgi:ATP-binding cassette subfamily B protein